MRGYNKLRKKSWDLLHSELPVELHYHSIRHTKSALKNCEEYIRYFDIDSYQAKLLRISILLHDIGFTVSVDDHELEGAKIANELMTEFDFTKSDIKVVTQLILATKLPQKPKNLLERIICDVDLDYLGRKDFYEISDLLYQELLEKSEFFDKTQWNRIQIDFLENHTYHTEFAKKRRQGLKEQRIAELKHKVSFKGRKAV
ncbi:HD domain-containing protein [Lutimonas halocynthiae]|uniref:HD domain-containing protein n=1 Tax=Lutimonas halocynthiae TaxID=1446477 RepID=UPI0025B2CBD6|nr:HD domain-containing protein [Lutimonas halocynthiae]MDN3641678.1 HD domain-containing protein [Lutimonas halocynthiae]